MRDEEAQPYGEYLKDQKAEIKKKDAVKEMVNEMECDICDLNISSLGFSPEPCVCKSCYEKMVAGKPLKEEEDG